MSSSEFGMESLTGESEWNGNTGLESEVAVIAITVIIGLAIGLVLKKNGESRAQTSVTEWLTTECGNTDMSQNCPWTGNHPLLLVAMDGFRADYLMKGITPVMSKLQNCGIQTPYLRPVYPTKSYPNLYTIVTGLYPESHGIVNDNMYDPVMKSMFKGTESNPAWWGGEPVWTTAIQQGKKSASCLWAGSDATLQSGDPQLRCYGTENNDEIVSSVIDWLKMDEQKRPDLITVYFKEPGQQGETHGPDSPEAYVSVKDMDNVIGELMTGLYRNHLDNCVNVIIVSDHGMSETSCLRQISLDYFLEDQPETENLLKFDGTSGMIYTDLKQKESQVVKNKNEILRDDVIDVLACRSFHLKIFSEGTTPIRHHYSNNNRIGNIIIDVEDKWLVLPDEIQTCPKGSHGYDESYENMHAIFLAHGPDLKHHVTTEPFQSIELYNLMAALLDIEPASNNGTTGALSHILRKSQAKSQSSSMDISTCSQNNERQSSCDDCNLQGYTYSYPNTLEAKTLPFGAPTQHDDMGFCILYGQQFSTIYYPDYKQPILSSYLLTAYQAQNYAIEESTCVLPDKRLTDSDNPDCKHYINAEKEIESAHLFDPGFSNTEDLAESYLSSNIVPMYSEFKNEMWHFLWSLVKEYAINYKNLHVSVGSVFDQNHDGKADNPSHDTIHYVDKKSKVAVPTHFYMILTKCRKSETAMTDCNIDDLDILSFILPHVPARTNCESDEDYLRNNMARIRDIELLTGLQMLTMFDNNIGARKRTFLPTDIWPSSILAKWLDLPCDEEGACLSDYKPLLLISFDGFRADYIRRNLTHAIEKLRRCGVQTPYMRSVFPTESFPNHYTIVTGLYPVSHGIVENYMYDYKMNAVFDEFTEYDTDWWEGEPLWVTAKNQGKQSASINWFGSDVNDPAKQPSLNLRLGRKESDKYEDGIDQVIEWLLLDKGERPDFITLYIDEPDNQGHEFGPESPEINDMLKYVDTLIQLLMDGLLRNNLHNCVNIMIVSDHGMTQESCQKQVALKQYYPGMDNVLSFLGTTGIINTEYRMENSSVVPNQNAPTKEELLKALECKNQHFDVFTKETLPVRYHYSKNYRIGNLVVDANEAWMISTERRQSCGKGNHGYDPAYRSMQALFLAHGPAFKQNFVAEPFENIELYNLMSGIIGVKPAPNNGTVGSLDYILRQAPVDEERNTSQDRHIESCSGMHDRTSTCQCDSSLPVVPPGDHKYHGGVALHEDRLSICSTTNSLFSTIYSKDFKQPIIVSSLITPKMLNPTPGTSASCVVPNPKFSDEENPDCGQYENADKYITRVSLFYSGFTSTSLETEEAELSSNMVPMYSGFYSSIWSSLLSLISEYVVTYKAVHVSLGPLFDRDYDGRADVPGVNQTYVKESSTVPVPTHFFAILLKCSNKSVLPADCDTRNIDILSFILPHVGSIPNCRSAKAFFKKNVVRVRDVELMTGLIFLTEVDWTLAARKRTHIPAELWSSY